MRYLPAIDGLRAIAVLAVVAYHAGLPVPAGFVGVDVFFVISGYLITALLAREQDATGRIDMLAFYARRVRRILPALVVVVAATVAASAVLLPDASLARVMRSAASALGVTANIHFQNATGGYFDQDSDLMPLLHTWSLSVEEQFYFIWPLLLVLIVRRRWLLVVLAALSLGLAQWGLQVDPEAAFFQMPARFWELAVGGLIALAPQRPLRGVATVGLVTLAIAIAYPMPAFPGAGALPAVLGAGLVVHAVHSGRSVRALELAPVRFVGLISYSLYLWHWPLLSLYRATHLEAPGVAVSLVLCAAAGVLAWLSYRFIETPARRGFRTLSARRVVGAGVTACLALILATVPVVRQADAAARATE